MISLLQMGPAHVSAWAGISYIIIMNHKTKRKWIAALRGGNYRQIRGILKDEGRYCALGVLYDIDPHAHISNLLQCEIIHQNDGLGKSFQEIADFLENCKYA